MLPELNDAYAAVVEKLGLRQTKPMQEGPPWRSICEYEGPDFRLRFKKEQEDAWAEIAPLSGGKGWTDLTIFRNFLQGRDPLENATAQEVAEFLKENVAATVDLLYAPSDGDLARRYQEFLHERGARLFPEWSER
jgi:hypothetical protein